jgi:hypothetical protein
MTRDLVEGVSAVADTQEVSAINPVASTANPNRKQHEARTCCPFQVPSVSWSSYPIGRGCSFDGRWN